MRYFQPFHITITIIIINCHHHYQRQYHHCHHHQIGNWGLFEFFENLSPCWKLFLRRWARAENIRFLSLTFNSISSKLVLPSSEKVKEHHLGSTNLKSKEKYHFWQKLKCQNLIFTPISQYQNLKNQCLQKEKKLQFQNLIST